MPDDHISEEQFLIEFFGNFGRDLGNPKQFFTDNPQDILEFVKRCAEEKKPAFISVQPRKAHRKIYGIEKIFYDFDYTNKSLKLTKAQEEKRKKEMEEEVKKFIRMLEFKWKILSPLIVKTRKGYHVYLYFDKVYEIDDRFKAVDTMLENILETGQIISDLASTSREMLLEILILLLIAFELILAFIEFLF